MKDINKSFNKLVNKALTKFDATEATDKEVEFLLNLTDKFTLENKIECIECNCNYYEKFIAFCALVFVFNINCPEAFLPKPRHIMDAPGMYNVKISCIIAYLGYSDTIDSSYISKITTSNLNTAYIEYLEKMTELKVPHKYVYGSKEFMYKDINTSLYDNTYIPSVSDKIVTVIDMFGLESIQVDNLFRLSVKYKLFDLYYEKIVNHKLSEDDEKFISESLNNNINLDLLQTKIRLLSGESESDILDYMRNKLTRFQQNIFDLIINFEGAEKFMEAVSSRSNTFIYSTLKLLSTGEFLIYSDKYMSNINAVNGYRKEKSAAKRKQEKLEKEKDDYEKAIAFFKEYLDYNEGSISDFLKFKNTTGYTYNKYRSIIKDKDLELYNLVEQKVNNKVRQNFAIWLGKGKKLIKAMSENDQFNILDYYDIINWDFNDFKKSLVPYLDLTKDENIRLNTFFKRFAKFQKSSPIIGEFVFGEKTITDEEKSKIIKYLKSKDYPSNVYTFKLIARKYVSGEIEL